jgi:hypothetical protein
VCDAVLEPGAEQAGSEGGVEEKGRGQPGGLEADAQIARAAVAR